MKKFQRNGERNPFTPDEDSILRQLEIERLMSVGKDNLTYERPDQLTVALIGAAIPLNQLNESVYNNPDGLLKQCGDDLRAICEALLRE